VSVCECETSLADLAAAHVLGEHAPVALQRVHDPPVHVHIVSAAADAPAEIHLHVVSEPRVPALRDDVRGTYREPRVPALRDDVRGTYREPRVQRDLILVSQVQRGYLLCSDWMKLRLLGL